jgi:hypothetical protein
MAKGRINFKRTYGPGLLEAGYAIVPIKRGEKHPGTRNWQSIEADEKQLASWIRSSYYDGLGCLGRVTPGIDIDVFDKEIVDKLVTWCRENIGVTPVRVGNAPRVLLPCAAPPGGLGPDNSPKYEDFMGNINQVEIKATGQQWVAYGVHPGTGNRYAWEGGELTDLDADFLPVLTGEKIEALFKYFESIVPDDWELKGKGRTRQRTGGLDALGNVVGVDPFENYTPPINISTDDLRRMLAAIDPDGTINGYGWRSVGMALYHQFEGSDEGKELFIEWSQESVDYDLNEIDARWPSWGAGTYGGKPLTAATIISMYNAITDERGEEDPTLRKRPVKLSEWVKRFALVELKDGTEVHDCGVPMHRAKRRTLRAFKEHNAAYIYTYQDENGDIKSESMVEAWKASHDTRHYSGFLYNPGAGRFCTNPAAYDDDAQYINSFFFPPHVDDGMEDESRLEVFFDFLKHLFPEDAEREWFIMWLARLIQHPSVRSFVTPVNVTSVTGTGRGLLFEVLQQLVGGHNTHDVSKDDMEGRFNGFLDKCILAVVQEIKAATGEHKYQAWERMKSLLADTTANIQMKGQDSYTAPVYANFLMFSNNIDALPIDDVNERRIYAMKGAAEPITTAEIDRLNTWRSNDANIAALFHYLKDLKVDPSAFKRAPVSATKIQMVAASMGEEGDTLMVWLAEEAPKVFTYEFAIRSIVSFCGGDDEDFGTFSMDIRTFGRKLRDRGYHAKQIRTEDGRRPRVYYNPNFVKDDPQILRQHLHE